MTTIKEKILQSFKNLKSDAIPQPPRDHVPQDETFTENEIKNKKKNKQNKFKNFKFPSNNKKDDINKDKFKNKDRESVINTQASGHVINIVNSKDIHWGNEVTYNLGTNNLSNDFDCKEEEVEINEHITTLLSVTEKPEHVYMDYICKNLGRNWHGFFRTLGYSQGRIETVEMDEAKNGVSEARYKLLLDWVRNDEDGSLGAISTKLWEHGEKSVVKDLANIYHEKESEIIRT